MTIDGFRRLALGFPEALESAHMGHPDFRVGGKIFATLFYPNEEWGMVKLTPEQQAAFVKSAPEVFNPVSGGWGAQGATQVCLKPAKTAIVRSAMTAAWLSVAPKRLAEQFDANPTGPKAGSRRSRPKTARPTRRSKSPKRR